jgi:hypothetical protein
MLIGIFMGDHWPPTTYPKDHNGLYFSRMNLRAKITTDDICPSVHLDPQTLVTGTREMHKLTPGTSLNRKHLRTTDEAAPAPVSGKCVDLHVPGPRAFVPEDKPWLRRL